MNNRILVSTITPCFRMKRYLKKFLEEIPNQTMFDNLEIVLDHNEPDEEEVRMVREFNEKYPGKIKHIVVKKVDPIGVSMNRCIHEASADILTIWNIDDLRTPDSIELQYKKITESEECGLVYGDFLVVRSFGSKEGSLVDCSRYGEADYSRSMIYGPFLMFRKSLCEKAGYFDEQLKSGADFDFAMRLAFNTAPKMADGLLGYYLNEGLGASTRPDSLQQVERTMIELRYGIYDKIDYDLVAKATQYDILNVAKDGCLVAAKKYVPNYAEMIKKRQEESAAKGLNKFLFGRLFGIKTIKLKLKKIIKPLYMKYQARKR